jgi:SAM-dependent methyltransferase
MSQSHQNADQEAFWNGEAGTKWAHGQDRLDAMLAAFSSELLRHADIRKGEHVLDVGCGCGGSSVEISKLSAVVTGVDISRPMLERARIRSRDITFLEADASVLHFSPTFDVVVSRFGVMFFADPIAAFTNLRSALKPTGRLVFVCWRDWRENEWVRIPISAVRPHLPQQPSPNPDEPGPFAFADLARVRRILTQAGFDQISIMPFDAPMSLGSTLDDAISHIQDFGPVSRMLSTATQSEKASATNALHQALAPFSEKTPLTLNGAVWIVTAKA